MVIDKLKEHTNRVNKKRRYHRRTIDFSNHAATFKKEFSILMLR